MAKSKPTSRDLQKQETYEQLFNAAIDEFSRAGVEETRIEQICEAAGVAKGTFFFHFPTKEDVLLERQRRISEAMAARLQTELASVRSPKGFMRRWTAIVMEEHEAVGSLELVRKINAAIVRTSGNRSLGVAATAFGQTMTEQIARLQEAGTLRGDVSAAHLADCLRLSFFGYLVDPSPSYSHMHSKVDLFVELMSSALRPN